MRFLSILRTFLVLGLLLPIFHVHVHLYDHAESQDEICTLCTHTNIDDGVLPSAHVKEITTHHYLSDASLIAYISTSLQQQRARAPPANSKLS